MTNKLFTTILFTALISLSFTSRSQTHMNTTKGDEYSQPFYVVGITTRTMNENGQSAKDIEALWVKFWGEEVQKKIPNKASDDIYAVYFDYETDFTGHYSTLIGLPVTSLKDIPKGYTGITIKSSRYKKFTSKGKMPAAILNTWLGIWGDKELNTKRAYTADFTVHGEKYNNGENAEVETFISVRE
jgi:predicted transcriptional regulator YdeE